MRNIALINESTLVGADDVSRCLAALQTQVSRDFADTWGVDARLRAAAAPGDAEEALYLLDDAAQADALGCHGRLLEGRVRPCGFVFVRRCLEAGDPWQAVASHELLEMLADPLLNLAAEGAYEGKPALFAVEVCDPVEADTYDVAGVPLSNFVLPTWFLAAPLPDDTLVDFLGRLADPFTLSPGGYATYCREIGRWQQRFAKRCPRQRRQAAPYSRPRRRGVRAAALV